MHMGLMVNMNGVDGKHEWTFLSSVSLFIVKCCRKTCFFAVMGCVKSKCSACSQSRSSRLP